MLPGILSPDPPDLLEIRHRWLWAIGFLLAWAAAIFAPFQWLHAGYVFASLPCAWFVFRQRRFVLVAIVPVAYAILKGGYLPPWTMAALLLGLAPMFLRPRRVWAAAWAVAILACAIEYYSMPAGTVPPRRELVVVGDSLCTFGLIPELRKTAPVPVQDRAQPGITAAYALRTIVPELEQLEDRCFVVELGGHDYLRGEPIEETLEEIVQRLKAKGNDVILVEIPNGLIRDSFGGVYRRLARRYGAALISDTMIRRFVLQPSMSNDGLHPSLEGSRLFAEEITRRLSRR